MGSPLADEIHQETVERLHFDSGSLLGGEAHQLHPFVQGQYRMLLRVRGHRHVDLVEQAQAPVDEVHMPVGDRVERARIDADPHAEASARSRWYTDRQVSP